MKPSLPLLNLLVIFILLIVSGCYSTKQTTKKSELERLAGVGPIRILTIDNTLYFFDRFSYTDSTLTGEGTLSRNRTTKPFEGTLPFSEIVFIERLEFNPWRFAWIVPMTVAVAAGGGRTLSEPSEVRIWRPTEGGSCPYVYAFNGFEYILEAEAFATSISRSLETKTFHVLSSLTAKNGQLYVRVSNERPETHLVNSVQLFAADAGESPSVVLDTDNILRPLHNEISPTYAYDHSGNDILSLISIKNEVYWESDLSNITPMSGFRDEITLEFDIPSDVSEGILSVHAINSDLITEVYRSVGTILGDATLEFYLALEKDEHLQNIVRDWISESSLLIEVNDGGNWKQVGTITPEANVASFSRAIRLSNLDSFNRPLTVRLSSLTDVWRIDAVSIDYTSVEPFALHPLEMTSVNISTGMDWRDAISFADSSYALLLPPDYMDITFDSTPVLDMQNPVYVFAAQGYLYEWFPVLEEPVQLVMLNEMTGNDRIELLKLLIQKKDLFLPPLYARWKKERN